MSSVLKQRGCSIRIFLVDGTPDGVRTVDKSNWSGRAIVCPRSRFKEAKARAEFDRTGLYILVGPPSSTGDVPTLYIGECDPLRPRLEQHYAKKDFWTQAIVFTSKDEGLNKAHVQYLESRMVALARQAKRCSLENLVIPAAPSLSEGDVAEMEAFLDEILLVLPVIGLHAFERPAVSLDDTPQARLTITGAGVTAYGYESDAGFVVLRGSDFRPDEVGSIPEYQTAIRQNLISTGIVVDADGGLKFVQDYTFDSPSTAASVVLGRSTNGRVAWKDEAGRTLKELQVGEVLAQAAAVS